MIIQNLRKISIQKLSKLRKSVYWFSFKNLWKLLFFNSKFFKICQISFPINNFLFKSLLYFLIYWFSVIWCQKLFPDLFIFCCRLYTVLTVFTKTFWALFSFFFPIVIKYLGILNLRNNLSRLIFPIYDWCFLLNLILIFLQSNNNHQKTKRLKPLLLNLFRNYF